LLCCGIFVAFLGVFFLQHFCSISEAGEGVFFPPWAAREFYRSELGRGHAADFIKDFDWIFSRLGVGVGGSKIMNLIRGLPFAITHDPPPPPHLKRTPNSELSLFDPAHRLGLEKHRLI